MRLLLFLLACDAGGGKPMDKSRIRDLQFETIDDDLAMPEDLSVTIAHDLSASDFAAVDLSMMTAQQDLGGYASCKALHAAVPSAPSGMYSITMAGIAVWCDMATDGGGWTMAFIGAADNYQSDTIDYQVQPTVWATATDVLIAFRDGSNNILGDWARFPIPANWRSKPPFQWDMTDEAGISVVVSGAAAVSSTLHYGMQDFTANCGDPWRASTTRWGRICLENTAAPFFDGFTRTEADGCQKSTDPYGTSLCTFLREFSIGVR